MKIWKFVLKITDQQEVEMPLPARVLSVQMQPDPQGRGETICLWAEVDPDAKRVKVPIVIVGTGHELPNPKHTEVLRHRGTFQMHGGALVFHAYEIEQL